MNWQQLKQQGSEHYKTDDVEPIDLYKAGGCLHDFAVASIIKYAYRNRKSFKGPYIDKEDIRKIIHYAKLLEVLYESN